MIPARRAVTSPMDWILLLVLAFQVLSGVGVALFERWGSVWYLSTAVPWLWSLVRLHPDASTVTGLPVFIQAHLISGFVVILLFPFTRLVHVFAIPIEYLWRPYQVVIWNRDPRQPVSSTSAKVPLSVCRRRRHRTTWTAAGCWSGSAYSQVPLAPR